MTLEYSGLVSGITPRNFGVVGFFVWQISESKAGSIRTNSSTANRTNSKPNKIRSQMGSTTLFNPVKQLAHNFYACLDGAM